MATRDKFRLGCRVCLCHCRCRILPPSHIYCLNKYMFVSPCAHAILTPSRCFFTSSDTFLRPAHVAWHPPWPCDKVTLPRLFISPPPQRSSGHDAPFLNWNTFFCGPATLHRSVDALRGRSHLLTSCAYQCNLCNCYRFAARAGHGSTVFAYVW